MTVSKPRGQSVRHPLQFRLLQVRRVQRVTPRMLRITLGGEDLAGFRSDGADDHVKLFFPLDGDDAPAMPSPGPNGMVWPADEPRPPSRDFTPRRYDEATGELDIDFVIHGDGPASNWASNVRPGQSLGTGGPRGSFVVANDFDWYLLIGDETALPSIGRRLEELPAGARAVVVAEIVDADEEQTFQTKADLSVTWLHRHGAPAGSTSLLADAVRKLEFLPGECFAWASGEMAAMRDVRRHLLNERKLPKECTRVSGYWKYGVANHDHHEPVED